ncbi:hypothetical protein FIBSPDRAFT_887019 [Athelia psychrophila]|uniref:Xylanolytic transcriptional activator regulatory domain-containing protein n=1 Tax=Athelia psychrophila TaxID=1759441 RepID=A0A166Q6R3_9AGAM|nr:hypothetical protein FIBSPDRAFT_887019 [Fibularhizoctonia sp. CBS 109695]
MPGAHGHPYFATGLLLPWCGRRQWTVKSDNGAEEPRQKVDRHAARCRGHAFGPWLPTLDISESRLQATTQQHSIQPHCRDSGCKEGDVLLTFYLHSLLLEATLHKFKNPLSATIIAMLPQARKARASRRTSAKLTAGEDAVKKRARGEITCAECKRLKLKAALRLARAHDTEQLHRKITEMSERIRNLEEALAIFQSGVSAEPHPLLRDGLLSIKFAPQPPEAESEEPPSPEDVLAETIDAFGTLAIGNSGESRYFGRSGGSEAGAEEDVPSMQKDSVTPGMPDLINRLTALFPMGLGCTNNSQKFQDAIATLFNCLPPTPRARRSTLDLDARAQISPHKLAVLFLVMAIGANADFTLPPYNEEAELYYHCARAALALRSIFDSPLMETVQAILLLSYYQSSAGERHSKDSSWALIGLGCKLAQSLGMHRDPARWNMDEKTANKRRRLFWEMYSIDIFISLAMGRPPCIELSYVDCALPQDRTEADVWNWKYRFITEVYGSVIKLTLAANPPSYKTILELDRKFRTQTMLYLHKSFFAQALMDHPENPLLSRWWSMWSHLFSAAIIVGSIVTRAPSSNMASTAYLELGIAVSLFATGAEDSSRARRAMAILVQLQEKASPLFNQFHDSSHSPSPGPDLIYNQGVAVDELAIFGGQTSVLFSKKISQKLPNWDAGARTSPGLPYSGGLENAPSASTRPASLSKSVGQEQEDMSVHRQDVHPSLMEYMSMLSSTTADAVAASSHFMEQSGASEIAGPSQFSADLPNFDFFCPQPVADLSMQQAEQTQNTPMMDFTYDPNLFGPLEQFYREAAFAPSTPADMLEAKNIRHNGHNVFTNINDPGDGTTGDRWMRFVD